MVACGVAPRGKVAAARMGAGLVPLMLEGPSLPVSARARELLPPPPPLLLLLLLLLLLPLLLVVAGPVGVLSWCL
jgi:hypothetical protein